MPKVGGRIEADGAKDSGLAKTGGRGPEAPTDQTTGRGTRARTKRPCATANGGRRAQVESNRARLP
eukprot:23210-Alexandrium_andersonii.AAC.1